MERLLYERITKLEKRVKRVKDQTTPTFPITNPAFLPQDAINGQIVIGNDGSMNCFDNDTWYTKIGSPCSIGSVPQDILEGQVVIGTDDSLCFYVGGTWYGFAPANFSGNPPQDAIEGQIALQLNPPPPGTPAVVGSGSGGVGTIINPVPAGQDLIAIWAMYATDDDAGANATAAFDSKGNTYHVGNPVGVGPVNEAIGMFPSFITVGTGAAVGSVTTPLAAGDTVTVTITPDTFGATIEETIVLLYAVDPLYFKVDFIANNGMGSPSCNPDTPLLFQSGDEAFFPPPADFLGNALGAVLTMCVGFGGDVFSPAQGELIGSVSGSHMTLFASIIKDLANGSSFEPGGSMAAVPSCATYTMLAKTVDTTGGGGSSSGLPVVWFSNGTWHGVA